MKDKSAEAAKLNQSLNRSKGKLARDELRQVANGGQQQDESEYEGYYDEEDEDGAEQNQDDLRTDVVVEAANNYAVKRQPHVKRGKELDDEGEEELDQSQASQR